jgi:hypothetical protein
MASKVDFDRKDLKSPDAFFESVGWANRYFQSNRAAVIAGVAVLVALFIGGLSISRWRESRAEDAAATFLRGADALDADNISSLAPRSTTSRQLPAASTASSQTSTKPTSHCVSSAGTTR